MSVEAPSIFESFVIDTNKSIHVLDLDIGYKLEKYKI